MKEQDWIFSIRFEAKRHAVVGPARSSTVEAALHMAGVPEATRAEVRTSPRVRDFVEGRLDPDKSGYFIDSPLQSSWCVCIGSVQRVLR